MHQSVRRLCDARQRKIPADPSPIDLESGLSENRYKDRKELIRKFPTDPSNIDSNKYNENPQSFLPQSWNMEYLKQPQVQDLVC